MHEGFDTGFTPIPARFGDGEATVGHCVKIKDDHRFTTTFFVTLYNDEKVPAYVKRLEADPTVLTFYLDRTPLS